MRMIRSSVLLMVSSFSWLCADYLSERGRCLAAGSLRFVFYDLRFTIYALCFVFYALCFMLYDLCFVLCVMVL